MAAQQFRLYIYKILKVYTLEEFNLMEQYRIKKGRGRPKGTFKVKKIQEQVLSSEGIVNNFEENTKEKQSKNFNEVNKNKYKEVQTQLENENKMELFNFDLNEVQENSKGESNALAKKTILSVIGLKKAYKNDMNTFIFENLSFDIEEGDIIGIMGENGAGKSTLLKCITGLTPIDEGHIYLEGVPIENNRDRMGVLWVEAGMMYEYTVAQNLSMWATLYGITYTRGKAIELLNSMGIGNLIDKQYKLLSTGQRRKVSIVRTFLNDVPFYILDETTSGLDIASQLKVQQYIKNKAINENKTFLMVTHLYTDLLNLCNKVMLIDRGQIVDLCTIGQLTIRYLTGYVFTLMLSSTPEVYEHIISYMDNKEIKYIKGRPTNDNISILYLKFSNISEFNEYEPVFEKYILTKKVDKLNLESFINLLLQGVVFRYK